MHRALEFHRIGDVAEQDFRLRIAGLKQGHGIASVVVVHAVDEVVAAEIIVPEQRRILVEGHPGVGARHTGIHAVTGPDVEVFAGLGLDRIHVASAEKGPGAGAQIAAACVDVFLDACAALGRERATVLGGQTAVGIEHPEARRAVGVEEDAVFVFRRAVEHGVLPQRIDIRQLLGSGRNEAFDRQAQIAGHRQVGFRCEPDAAVHEDVFVVAFAPGLCPERQDGCRQKNGQKEGCAETFHGRILVYPAKIKISPETSDERLSDFQLFRL